jgi:fructosamine-3-kinase
MNVREALLCERIDPALTPAALSLTASLALGVPVAVTSWKPLTGGCWNRVICLQGDPSVEALVLKIAPSAGDAGLAREYKVLRWFTVHTRLPVPEALHVDDTGSVIPGTFIVMRRIPGRPLHDALELLGGSDRRRLTIRVAEDIAELHQATAHGFGGVEVPEAQRVSWPDFWLPRFDKVREEAAGSTAVDPRVLSRIDALRARLPLLLAIGETGTLTHYDVWSGNVMVEPAKGGARVSGYIDVPGFWADPVRELSFAEMFGIADALFYEVYTSIHGLPDEWELRKDLYNLKMHLKHIMMYPGERYYRDGAVRCLASLEAGCAG